MGGRVGVIIGDKDVRFLMHGLPAVGSSDMVNARVFADKLRLLLAALGAADSAANGKVMHDYNVTETKIGSLDLSIHEYLKPKYHKRPRESSVLAFSSCISAVASARPEQARIYGKCSGYVAKMGLGAGTSFGYGELWARSPDPFRVDELLSEQASAVAHPDSISEPPGPEDRWFKGIVHSGFDGYVKGVDLRGSLPQVKLVLSAGRQELDCVFRGVELEKIRETLDRRVRIAGRAIYDGSSGLPRRVEVSDVSIIRSDSNFLKWGKTFRPFHAPEWQELTMNNE